MVFFAGNHVHSRIEHGCPAIKLDVGLVGEPATVDLVRYEIGGVGQMVYVVNGNENVGIRNEGYVLTIETEATADTRAADKKSEHGKEEKTKDKHVKDEHAKADEHSKTADHATGLVSDLLFDNLVVQK